MKLRIVVIAAAVALILSTGLVSPSAGLAGDPGHNVALMDVSWARGYGSMEELCADADVIAVGTITAIEDVKSKVVGEDRWGPIVLWGTDFAFAIEEVLKGPQNLSEVVINQMGAHSEWEANGHPLFNPEEQYVVFLDGEDGRYATLSGPYGKFRIIDDEVFSMLYFVHPELINYEPEEVIEYYDPSESFMFYLNIKGIDKQTFVESVLDTMVCGVKGYVGGNIPRYGFFPLQGAKVEVQETGAYAFTNQNGYYEIPLAPGVYTLTASYFTFSDQTYYNVQVALCEFTQRTFSLQQIRPGGPIPLSIPDPVL